MTIDTETGPLLGTAGWHATRNVPIALPQDRAADVWEAMRDGRFDSASVVAVCEDDRLRGLLSIERLLAAPAHATMADLMDRDPPIISPGADQEHAAWQAVHHHEPTLAVVDADGRFAGLISPSQLLGVLLEEHDEDLARLGGYLRSSAAARSASEESVPWRLWHRLPWLVLGLIGVLASAKLLSAFDHRFQAHLAVAFFLPGIVYLAAAVGNQTQTLAVRGLSVGVGIGRVAGREAITGLLVGAVLGTAMVAIVSIGWDNRSLALAVGLAVLFASAVATLVAMALPWLLQRAGKDPAYGSGPVATIIQDLISISVYMGTVSALL